MNVYEGGIVAITHTLLRDLEFGAYSLPGRLVRKEGQEKKFQSAVNSGGVLAVQVQQSQWGGYFLK